MPKIFTTTLKQHPQAALILALFIALALIYSRATPPFEAGDESRHYAVVKYIAETGRLPVQNVPETAALQHHWSHEGNQPPLYYALAAALTAWIDAGSWDDVFWYNPHTTIGNPLRPDNKNITIHPPNQGWRGHLLAVQLIRLMSIGMAAVTVATCHAIALSLFKGHRWLAAGAMAITAFNPMFIFISASVNNDNAVIMFVTLTIYQLTKSNEQLLRSGNHVISRSEATRNLPGSPAPNTNSGRFLGKKRLEMTPIRYAALLGLLIGLGALSKLYAFGLLPLAGLRLLWLAQAQSQLTNTSSTHPTPRANPQFAIRNLQSAIPPLLTLIAVFLAVAGWFYLRNALLYNGDIFALDTMRETAGQRREAPTLATLRAEFEGFRIAYWALFGGVNILADRWIYTLLDALTLAAALGLAVYVLRFTYYALRGTWNMNRDTNYALRMTHDESPPHSQFSILHSTFLILLAWAGIMVAGFIVWNLTQPAGQGRLLYPAISALSALGLLGLTWWLPTQRLRQIMAMTLAAGLLCFAAATPFLYIAPAYTRPPLLTEANLPADLQPVDFLYDDTVRLIGYQLHTPVVRPAEALDLTLYWQIVAPPTLDYSIFVHLLGRQRQVIGQIDSYPGGGAWPATLLQPGDVLADRYRITVAPQAEFGHAPARLQIAAGIYDFNQPGRPGKAAVDAAGNRVDPIIGVAKLVPWQWPDPPVMAQPINFFDKATLLSYDIAADQQTVTLNWRADGSFEADYTVFLQAWRLPENEYIAGFDGPPVGGDYPTSLWAAGEVIVDVHSLDLSALPPGDYRLLAGLYNPTTGERLPAFGPDRPLPDYAVELGRIQVTR